MRQPRPEHRPHAMRWHLGPLGAALLAGCTVGPNYVRPTEEVPAGWRAQSVAPAASAASAAEPMVADALARSRRLETVDAAGVPKPSSGDTRLLDTQWWKLFGDPQLEKLIKAALEGNKDLKIAAARIDQFDAFLQVTTSAQRPQLSYDASRSRNALSENRQQPLNANTKPVDNDYALSGGATWALDFFGKLRRSEEAAVADLVASEEGRRALGLSVVAEVASGYLRLISLDRELELLRQNVVTLRQVLALTEAKFRDGAAPELPVVQAEADLLQATAEIPPKEAEIVGLENALSQLVGRNPGPIERGRTLAQLQLPPVPASLPSSVLAQRPDVRKAEQALISANAQIGVATANYYPSISLFDSSGFAANSSDKLAQLSSNFGAMGVSISGPLFTSGRISGQVREAEALQAQASLAFLRSLQTAYREAEDALERHGKLLQRADLSRRRVAAQDEYLKLATARFKGGFSGYLDVLNAQIRQTQAQLAESNARSEQFVSLVTVYAALGGGWALPEKTAPREDSILKQVRSIFSNEQ